MNLKSDCKNRKMFAYLKIFRHKIKIFSIFVWVETLISAIWNTYTTT